LPIRYVPTPRRYASDRPLDHRAWQLPRHDLAVQLAKAEFVAINKLRVFSAGRLSAAPPKIILAVIILTMRKALCRKLPRFTRAQP
jgi:hypothetical protein